MSLLVAELFTHPLVRSVQIKRGKRGADYEVVLYIDPPEWYSEKGTWAYRGDGTSVEVAYSAALADYNSTFESLEDRVQEQRKQVRNA